MIPLERSSASPFYFDGFKGSGNDIIKIEGTFLPQENPKPVSNAYSKIFVDNYAVLNRYEKEPGQPDPDNTNFITPTKFNTTFPLLLIISDSFWVFQVGKMPRYVNNGRTWMEILEQDYNSKFQQLTQQVKQALSNQ
jgi:hypothetical protein